MSLRDQRQAEFAQTWINSGKFGILNLCPRFGKIYTSINIMEKLKPKKVLVAYPDKKILHSWQHDLEARGYNFDDITFTTFLSMKKHLGEKYDLVIIDEIHLLSSAQKEVAAEIIEINRNILGLTGTLSRYTEKDLLNDLGLSVVATYTIDQAISEGVIVDYEITVVKVPLDARIKQNFKGKYKTEKQRFDELGWIINKMEMQGRDTMFMRLARMRIIQSSLAKQAKTTKILNEHPDERILVFCGVTAVADNLGIPSYHSKSSEKTLFEDFMNGKGNHMAVVKIGNTGVTYKPLNKVIINYFDSNSENLAQKINRCMSMEYGNPDKKAHIYIITSDEEVERKWLNKALEFFDKSKIKWL